MNSVRRIYNAVISCLLAACAISLMLQAVPPADAARAVTDRLGQIRRLAAEAYVWGLAPEFTYRFAKYNTIISAPINALTYGSSPAAWNNSATNAGDSSIIYINGFMDFSGGEELVLTVPPSRGPYYVVNYLDNYINTVGSIGTRTTPSDESTSYLLVGPKSRYARKKVVVIRGHSYRVMASDTNLNWMLIRIRASTLADSSDPKSTNSTYNIVSKQFALNTLKQFQQNDNKPVFPSDYTNPPPTRGELIEAALFKDTPEKAERFFEQLGQSLVKSPIPSRAAVLGGTPLGRLPPWVVPQYGATSVYLPPSSGQDRTLRRFAPIGLTANGFKVPKGWGPAELAALQEGYELGQNGLNAAIDSEAPGESTNYWTILNDLIGTYPNTVDGYLVRATIVLNGGSANVPLDAVYPNMNSNDGVSQLDGDNTYTLTFTPPQASPTLPVYGSYPPQVTDTEGDILGFWSVTVYQPDPSEVSAPFLMQSAVLNTAYSKTEDIVTAVNSGNGTITVLAPSWGRLIASTPILFSGAGAEACGLNLTSENTVYYVADAPVEGVDDETGETTYTFPISTAWLQDISSAKVPIQYSGSAGQPVPLTCDSKAGLTYGVVRPVSQLGSSELESGQLELNGDGSLTIWIGPTLPDGAPATNWIPTPSSAYYDGLYPSGVSTQLQVILRSYYPMPGDQPPSLLPSAAVTPTTGSYIPPKLVKLP